MRIRTRYKLFKIVILLAVVVFVVSLYDMFIAPSEQKTDLQAYVLIAYAVLILVGLVLYIGRKPKLTQDEPIIAEELAAVPEGVEPEPLPTLEEQEEAVEIVEVPKPRQTVSSAGLGGPSTFRCPFCSNLFALEATHVHRDADVRMTCPYCTNRIRIPRRPKVARGKTKGLRHVAPSDQVLYACNNCGEVLRFSAPGSQMERALLVQTCPNCKSRQMTLATAA